MIIRSLAVSAAAIAIVASVPTQAWAQERTYAFDIPAGDLGTGIRIFAKESHQQVSFDGALVGGKRGNEVKGSYEPEQALARLLEGTGVAFRKADRGVFILSAEGNAGAAVKTAASTGEAVAGSAAADRGSADIVVTGTRIKGAAPASETLQITAQRIREAGQHDLGEVVRSLPQNFGGGQNPGVAQGAGGVNYNLSSASAINLRGIGPDATLTLLNGRRLSYDGFYQAIDISAIPLDAVDRLEIVPDGASALYGSDAVAGVANVILKKDFTGVTVSARLGDSTDGGGFQQEYGAVGGTKWASGGFLIAYDYERQSPVRSDQRDYTRYMPEPADLLPYQRHHNALITAHQDLGDVATISIDALYNRRWAMTRFSPPTTSSRSITNTDTETYVISPTVTFHLPETWTVALNGTYGVDNNNAQYSTVSTATGQISKGKMLCDCNIEKSAEFDAEGPLFSLPGGDARLALGAGYRGNKYQEFYSGSSKIISGEHASHYGFGELFLPLIGASNHIPLAYALSISGALRYEHYSNGLGSIVTPKLGVIYAPTADFDIKGTWGRSFKVPTLMQQYSSPRISLYPAAAWGGVGYPANATFLHPYGGNPDLKPERATTWSVTADLHPRVIDGLQIGLSYFHIDYRDRVLMPITNRAVALSDPAFREFVTFNPSAAEQAALIAMAPAGLANFAGAAYDPANVVAIVNDTYLNVAHQIIHGVDLSSDYRFDWAGGDVDLSGNASWLTSRQQNSADGPVFALAGTEFNAPHFRARAGVTVHHGNLTASSFLNYIGRVKDLQTTPPVEGASMATIDLTLLYRLDRDSALLRGTELSLSIQNLANERPPYLHSAAPYIVDYDSNNYSALGRFVSVGISKHW